METHGSWSLEIDGAVKKPLRLRLEELRSLPQAELRAPFRCSEGWTIPEVHWEGVPAASLLSRAEPSEEARFVVAAAGEYTVLLARAELEAAGALVALRRDGRSLDPTREGPARLVISGSACTANVKGLQKLTLTAEAAPTTGEETARARSADELFRKASLLARTDSPLERCTESELQEIWNGIEERLPSAERTGSYTAAADMLAQLLRDRFPAGRLEGPLYRKLMKPLEEELQSRLGRRKDGDDGGRWFDFVRRCAAVYTDPAVPHRYRILAHQWARKAAGAAFSESGRVLVPPTLDGTPSTPLWLDP